MTDTPPQPHSDADADLQREILRDRKFSVEEAIGRMAGPGAMKGASPISRRQQAEVEIEDYLRQHLADPAGCLADVLLRTVRASDCLLDHYDQPLLALAACVRRILDSDYLLSDLDRDADVEW